MRLVAVWLLLAATTSIAAEPAIWIDLSGDWKIALGDQTAWARPEFDDSAWSTVRLPYLFRQTWQNQPLDWFWLRRTVDLPEGELSLTLGRLVENYEVYLEGNRVARVGDFTFRGSQLARPRTFDLAPGSSRRAVIAIRCWRHSHEEPSVFRTFPDSGPYLLTRPTQAPRDAGVNYLHNMRLLRSPDLALGVMLLTVAGILLLIFARQPQRWELFWLAGTCIALASMRLSTVLPIKETAYPAERLSLVSFVPALMIEFLMAAFFVHSRVLRVAAWALTGWGLFAGNLPGFVAGGVPVFVAGLAVFPIVLYWVAQRASPRDKEYWWTLATCVVLAVLGLKATSYLGPLTRWLPFSILFRLGPYELNFHATAWGFAGLITITNTVQRLLRDSAEKQRLAGELEAARVVQQLLLPAGETDPSGFSIDAVYEPAQEVGGDFHWRTNTAEGLLVVTGDVSGKGLRAAMLVSVVVGLLRQVRTGSPAEVLRSLNEGLVGHTGGGFVTCGVALFRPDGKATLASAGHPAPYVDGREAEVDGGLPLGIMAEAHYPETSLTCTRMTFVSDGVLEAANAGGELFGFERTRAIATQSAQSIAEAAKQWGQNDDITVVTVRRGE